MLCYYTRNATIFNSNETHPIDLSHPVLISLDTSTYGGHSVTGVGYDTDGGQYWIIHDNWPSTGEDIYVNSALSADRFYYPFIPPTHDSGAPSAAISAPRYHRAGTSIPVSWSGRDAATGVARYDVQSQVSGSASWQDLLTSTTDTSTTFAGQVGNTYTFRSRAYDWMGNVSAWVEAQSTVYQYQVTGRVTGNRDYGVIGAQVAAAPGALNTAQPSPGGAFGLYFAAAQTADLTASASGFGSLYAMKGVSVSHDYSGLHFALPPLTEQLTNGHFESELAGWQASTAPAPAAIQGAGHTGDYALALGMSASVTTTVWQITQSVTSVITDKPTLSWFYVVSGTTSADDRLWVSVARPGGLPTQTNILSVSLPLTATAWTHQWLALDEFAGSTVTITFGVQNADTSTVSIVLLDEVSLGEGNKQLRQIFLPVVFKTW